MSGRGQDEADFAAFVRARGQRLLHVAYLLTRDSRLAEDLLQASLARSWPRWRSIKADPEPYVRKVIANTYASWWRRRWRGEEPYAELPEAAENADATGIVDDRLLLWEALGTLAPRQRAVLVLRYLEDLTEAQTADALGLSVGAVKSTTSRALARLRTGGFVSDQEGVHDGA
jgi:RNA polymerase sigma-70 factor (sigma-E family)